MIGRQDQNTNKKENPFRDSVGWGGGYGQESVRLRFLGAQLVERRATVVHTDNRDLAVSFDLLRNLADLLHYGTTHRKGLCFTKKVSFVSGRLRENYTWNTELNEKVLSLSGYGSVMSKKLRGLTLFCVHILLANTVSSDFEDPHLSFFCRSGITPGPGLDGVVERHQPLVLVLKPLNRGLYIVSCFYWEQLGKYIFVYDVLILYPH